MLLWGLGDLAVGEDLVDVGVEEDVVDSGLGVHEAVPEGDALEGIVDGDYCGGGAEVAVYFADGAPDVVVVLLYKGDV